MVMCDKDQRSNPLYDQREVSLSYQQCAQMAIHKISITKAGKDAILEVDDQTLPDEVYAAVIAEGLKACLNAKMTKVGAVTKLEGEALAKAHAKALEIAESNLADLQKGTYKFAGRKAKSSEPREVHTEAMRLAKDIIRDKLRANGLPMNTLSAKDLTAAAKGLVENRPDLDLIAKAKENLAKRNEVPESIIDLNKLGIDVSAAKANVAKAKAEKSERAKGLSAAKAGKTEKVAGRQKPKADVISATAGQAHKPGPHAVH